MATRSLTVEFKFGPSWLVDAYKKMPAVMQQQFQLVHRKTAMVIAAHIVRFCRVDTGRFWNAWTPFLDAAGYNYQRYAPAAENPEGDAQAEGKLLGTFTDQPFYTILNNGVKYGLELEQKTGIFREGFGSLQGAAPKFSQYLDRTFALASKVIRQAVEEGRPVDVDPGAPDL